MNVKKLLLLLGLTIAATGTASAAVHTISYAKNSVAVGTPVTLGGDDYVIVRIPFATFNLAKYSIIMPAPTEGFVFVTTTHSDAAFTSNITVDGLPARINLGDSRTYGVSGAIGVASTFSVAGDATATLDIKIGTTIVSIFASVGTNETNANAGNAVDFRSFAQWAKYKDLTAQVQVLNDLIDYVRIIRPAP